MRTLTQGLWVAVAVALLLGGTARAQEPEYARLGWYVVAGGSFVLEDVDSSISIDFPGAPNVRVGDIDADDSYGIFGRVGYRFHETFALEMEVEWIDTIDADGFAQPVTLSLPPALQPPATVAVSFPLDMEFDIYTVMLNGKFYFSPRRVQPYLLVGMGIVHSEIEAESTPFLLTGCGGCPTLVVVDPRSTTDTSLGFQFGLGVDLYVNRNFAVNLEGAWILNTDASLSSSDYDGSTIHWWTFGLGLQYRF